MRLVRRRRRRWLDGCCCCSRLCRRRGREGRGGGYKSSLPLSGSLTLEGESGRWGVRERGTEGPSNPLFTNNRRLFPNTVPSQHTDSEKKKPPSTSTNKCQEKPPKRWLTRIDAQTWRRRQTVGQTRSDKAPKAHGTVAAAFLNAYPLCPGNDEARDQRRRGISVEISKGKRTRKRPTGPNVQPKLTGHLVR